MKNTTQQTKIGKRARLIYKDEIIQFGINGLKINKEKMVNNLASTWDNDSNRIA